MEPITASVGRDRHSCSRYEFCIFEGEELIHRAGGFKSTAAARRAAVRWANENEGKSN